jgi:hypothetical protein
MPVNESNRANLCIRTSGYERALLEGICARDQRTSLSETVRELIRTEAARRGITAVGERPR